MPDHRLPQIYLDDHAAVATATYELIGRMIRSGAHRDHAGLLVDVRDEIAGDRRRIEECLAALGTKPSRVKLGLAWLAEKGGRFKLNGRVLASSPLTPLVELEGLGLALEAHRALWRAMERRGPEPERDDFRVRADRVERRMREIEDLRLRAADVAL
jgi:hypothetical protein